MTWFFDENAGMPTEQVKPLTGQVPSRTEQLIGSSRDLWLRGNTWNADQGYRNDLFDEMTRSIGGLEHFMPRDRNEVLEYKDPLQRGYYLSRRIGELKKNDPQGTYAHLPGSPDEFDAQWQARRQHDFDENRAMLERGDSTTAKVAGNIVGAIADPINIALAPVGGPVAGAGRFIAAEAALGAVAEVPGTLAEHERADDLGFTPDDPVTRIAGGAIGGAGVATVMYGGHRLLTYNRTRVTGEAASRPPGQSGLDHQSDIDTAEADLRAGREPAAPRLIGTDPVMGGAIDDGYYAAIRSAESGGNDAAKNPKSSATGRYQFTAGTWATLQRNNPELGLTADGRLDPAQQEIAIRAFTEANADSLRGADIPVTRGNLYAAHFLGIGDARRVLRAAPGARITDLLSPQVIQANPFLRNMRVEDFQAWAGRKTNGGKGGVVGDVPAVASAGIEFPAPRHVDWFGEVSTPAGMSVDVRYRVIDLGELQKASGDLQPRDRSRSASDEQIAGIARNLDPRRLMPSPESTGGAPIIGPDMVVESGNGRVAALNRAADEHPDRYQSYIRAIEDAGFEVPDGMSRPALVAERISELDVDGRRRFVRESNTSSIGRMSATEQAGLDADYLTQHAFDGFSRGRGLNSPENTEFVRRVFSAMPQAERAGLMTTDGRLNIDGLRRLRQSLFARAFDAQDLLKLLAETEHPAVENLMRMLEDLAPDWAAFRAAIDAGYIRAEFDITDQLIGAVRMIAKARIESRDGQSVIAALRDRLAQGDMFASRDPDLTDALIGIFYKGDRARGPDVSADILTRYLAEAEIAGRADIDDMFAADAGLTPTTVLREATRAQDARAPMPNRSDTATESLEGAAGGQPDIRALDGLKSEDGAQSAALTRATDAELREMKEAAAIPAQGIVHPERRAATFDEARAAVKDFQGRDLTNSETGIVAQVSRRSLDKMFSKSAVAKSSSPQLHSMVVANIDSLFTRATMGWSKPDRASDTNIAAIHRFFAPMDLPSGRMGMVKLTVKETVDPNLPNRVYTVEAVETLESAPAAVWADASIKADGIDPTSVRSAGAVHNMAQAVDDFNLAVDAGSAEASALADARAALEAEPGLILRMGEGDDAAEITLADLLDDLEQDEALMRSMTSCNLKGAPK